MPNIRIKKKRQKPLLTMITPGRRALGESWSKVTVTPNADTGKYDVEREATDAPARNVPIIVPALNVMEIEMADFILEKYRKEQEYQAKNPKWQHNQGLADKLEEWFWDYAARKLAAFRRTSQSGPSGWTQRG